MCVTHYSLLLFSFLTSFCLAVNRGFHTGNSTFDTTLNTVLFNSSQDRLPSVVTPSNNLTIEILPSDEDEDDALSFGILRDAYGFGEEIRDVDGNNDFQP